MAPSLDELSAEDNNAAKWEAHYQDGDAPWDKGKPSPAVAEVLRVSTFSGPVLVPGCGRGHDAVAIAQAGHMVSAIDLAETGIADARAHYPDHKNIFSVADLFQLDGSFGAVFEHTCFCAVHPEHRETYVQSVHRLLKPDGRYFGVLYVTNEAEEIPGPPFRIPRDKILDYFTPWFEVVWSRSPADSFGSREGKELLVELAPRVNPAVS